MTDETDDPTNEHYDADVHVRPVSDPDAAWEPFGTVSRYAAIETDEPDPLDAWTVRTTDSFTIRFTALEDAMSDVLRSVGESVRDAWEPFRKHLDYVLFGMTARTSERSARKTANARRNRLRRKRNRRRRRRG